MNSTEAYALWEKFDTEGGSNYPCTQQADDPCRFIDTDEHPWGKCKACGYVTHDVQRDPDLAHEELCCGSATCAATDSGLCITHDSYPES